MQTLNTLYEDFIGLSRFVQQNHGIFLDSGQQTILVQIFSGHCEKSFLAQLTAEIKSLLPHAVIIGTTTSGEIVNGQVVGLQTVLSFSILKKSAITSGFFRATGNRDFELGQHIAAKLGNDRTKLLILFATGLSDPQEMLMGIQSFYPRLPVAGGIAGNNSFTEQCSEQYYVICNDQILASGVVGVAIEGNDITVNCYSHLGWQPIGKEMTITKTDGQRIYTIDDIPAYEIYKKYLGLDKIGDFCNVLEYPLIVERQGIRSASTPYTYYEDDSIGFAAKLFEGEKVRLSFGHVGMISEAISVLCETIKAHPAESIFIYSCECRRGFLQELSKIETKPLQEIAPTAGFFTLGEFFHIGNTNQLLNATMTVLVLAESANTSVSAVSKSCLKQTEQKRECNNYVNDHVTKRNTGVLKALTHLVNTVTSELLEMNQKLQYLSLHDSLTGLYNRTFFEQEIARLEYLNDQIGIIVCDLDCLKTVNDIWGHAAGDKFLKLAAKIISGCCSKNDIVARIGGDEFAVIVKDAEYSLLKNLRNRIVSEAATQRHLHPEMPLDISVGIALREQVGERSIKNAFVAADANMYQHKLTKKKILSTQDFTKKPDKQNNR
ncbi:sensor domain-containing diguanylate cyclase [Sporomusa acidovorans]|uniref:GGDEF domain-containing protein n=1 Tax=Sporomusa acidovorans (strain ATCC 49682 / DSM 3132 / Mol) TaxID=1123286 RepID=A0ABZ3J416_SPOA4|nr:FIST N-terminal domain-containing protein [Sporomusa acidovorans]OZC15502.1 cyclic di-GMP phosphodiesterase CdpA [Sporomusa acidovorans DSM 3132]SDE16364.1 diguanylate cyclase (GGDEF) domain-containing protein [Sporomusa acidovorans]